MSVPKNLPFPVGFTNTRTFMQIRTDFPGASGVGAAIMLIDYAVAQPEHEFFFDDIGFLSRNFDVSQKILEDIVISYDLFKIYENEENKKVCSPFIIKNLEPYYEAVENGKIGGQIAAKKRKIQQKKQLIELENSLSQLDSIQGGYVHPTTTPQPYNKPNKVINKEINKSLSSREVERDIFKNLHTFKSHFISKNTNELFKTDGIGYATTTALKINEHELIVNTVNNKILSSKEAYKVWDYLFNFYKNQQQGA
ncbi:MAG: hypothetical protein RBT59_08845 [Arcobacteraceae bacterium]|jgi:hypothetical protein|nr:hypothetical protein [Arcobacteraceae bacterium]